MNDAQPFLDAICANHAEDAPRLVFADWLEERGECARAEFIRVQIAIHNRRKGPGGLVSEDSPWLFGDLGFQRLRRRERELWNGNRLDWLPQEPVCLSSAKADISMWSRGFVASICCTLAEWCGGPCVRCDGSGEAIGSDRPGQWSPDPNYMKCPVCLGAKTTTGHAGEICLWHPIESVTLTDRRPYCSDGECDFWNADRKGPSHALPEWCSIPSVLFFMLDGYNPSFNNDRWKAYRAEADALAALNRAAVKLGRERAAKLRIARRK